MAELDLAQIEARTQQIGQELFAASLRRKKGFLSGDALTARLMEWSMRHEEGRLSLFRFVDVLPALTEPDDVVRHLREYFSERENPFSGLMRIGAGVGATGVLGSRAVAAALRKGVEQVARTFIAGSTATEVLRVVEQFRRGHLAFTVDVLGEATLSEQEADRYLEIYRSLLIALGERAARWSLIPQCDQAPWGELPKVNLSVKLSALYSQLNPVDPEGNYTAVRQRLAPLFDLARTSRAHLQIDMEDYHLKDLTLNIFQRMAGDPANADYRFLGIVLQGYLRESEEDAKRLIAWAQTRGTPVTVRLVKGAYWDYETVHARLLGWPVPVYERKPETDANFERLTRLFLTHADAIDLAIGSHNIRSIAHAIAAREALGLPQGSLEFQFLYGMAEELRTGLVERGERVRVYTPFGELIPGMAYLVRRLLENSSNESFLRRGFLEHESPQVLMQNPLDAEETKPDPQAPGHAVTENEPPTDFAEEAARRSMQESLRDVAARLGDHYPLWISGKAHDTPERLVSENPSRPSQVVGTVASATAEHAELAVDQAARAYRGWSETPVGGRAEVLRRAAAIMRERRFELAAWIVFEAGKPWPEADGDVAEAIDFMTFYANEVEALMEPRRLGGLRGEVNTQLYEARGVAVVIAPWNFPLAILTGMASAALVTGNAVIVKPAEQTPVIAWKLVEIMLEAGCPPEVLHFLPGVGEVVGARLVEDARVHTITFTGSKAVGTHLFATAAGLRPEQRHLKRVIAEMGGKNAIIVDDDADLDEAVAAVSASAFGYAGQKCSACSRAIVMAPIYDRFLERLVEATRSLRIGPAEEPGTFIGPVISEEAQHRILRYIEHGKSEGQAALIGEIPLGLANTGGYFVPPAIFAGVDPKATIACEEIFGPVLSIMRANTFDQALEIALDTEYALTGGLFSRSPRRIDQARRAFRVGNLYVNRKTTGALVGRQPFGGFALSGTGFKAGSPEYLLQFVDSRVITENTLRRGFASE